MSTITPITAVRNAYSLSLKMLPLPKLIHSLSLCALSDSAKFKYLPFLNHHRSSKMVSGMVVLVVAASRALSSNYLGRRCLRDRDQSGPYLGNHEQGLTSASRSDTLAWPPRIFHA